MNLKIIKQNIYPKLFNHSFSNDLIILLFLIITNFLAHFRLYHNFGLYEDDYFRIPEAMEMSLHELKELSQYLLLKANATQGRPLHIIFIYLFSFIGAKLGGINGIYLIAIVITTMNVLLIYFLLWRISHSYLTSITGSLCFILFPADTTKIWLTSLFGLQTALTFILIAFHLYISKKPIFLYLSYLFILLSLITYETPFFVFLTAALLKQKRRIKIYWELLLHSITLFIIISLVSLWRSLSGESRVANLDLWDSMQRALSNMLIGTSVSIKSYFTSSWQSLFLVFYENLFIFVIVFFIICLVIILHYQEDVGNTFLPQNLKLISTGILMVILAYPLTLNLSATEIHGTWSRIHLSATLGVAFLGGYVCAIIINFNHFWRIKFFSIGAIIISFLFSLLLIYGINIQKDYALNWQYQKEFWQEITPLISDLDDGDLVLVEPTGINLTTKEMRANHWNTPAILPHLYNFPSDWKSFPKVYILTNNWQDHIITNDHLLLMSKSTLESSSAHLPVPFSESTIPSNKVILIQINNGNLIRANSPFKIKDKQIAFKTNSTKKVDLSKKSLGRLMLNPIP